MYHLTAGRIAHPCFLALARTEYSATSHEANAKMLQSSSKSVSVRISDGAASLTDDGYCFALMFACLYWPNAYANAQHDILAFCSSIVSNRYLGRTEPSI